MDKLNMDQPKFFSGSMNFMLELGFHLKMCYRDLRKGQNNNA